MRWIPKLFLFSLWSCVTSLVLEGSTTSYAQFRKWSASSNASLEFEFRTERPNGVLLYTDDGGYYDFLEIKLVDGTVRLRYNLGGGAEVMSLGQQLYDGEWHKVGVRRQGPRTTFSVDNLSEGQVSRGRDHNLGNLTTNSYVYIGGLPPWYSNKLTSLALPSVVFEPRYQGEVRNIIYPDDEDGVARLQGIIAYKVTGIKLHCNRNLPVSGHQVETSFFFPLLRPHY